MRVPRLRQRAHRLGKARAVGGFHVVCLVPTFNPYASFSQLLPWCFDLPRGVRLCERFRIAGTMR